MEVSYRICQQASRTLYTLRILRPILSSDQFTSVYFALIGSLLEYAVLSFGKSSNTLNDDLDKIQRRCHHLTCRTLSSKECPCNRFTQLSEHRNNACLYLFKAAIHKKNHVLHHIIPSKSHRSSRFRQPPTSTTRHSYSFLPFTRTVINGIGV